MFETVDDATEIESCIDALRLRLEAEADEKGELKLGYQGDNEQVGGLYFERLEMWAACSRTDVGGTLRYWNAFGFGHPFGQSLSITVEVNSPIAGINRRIGGVLARDGERVLLAHRGKVGGGRKGIGKAAFREFWARAGRETIQLQDGDQQSDVIPVGYIDADDFCDQIASFVRAVDDFKRSATAR